MISWGNSFDCENWIVQNEPSTYLTSAWWVWGELEHFWRMTHTGRLEFISKQAITLDCVVARKLLVPSSLPPSVSWGVCEKATHPTPLSFDFGLGVWFKPFGGSLILADQTYVAEGIQDGWQEGSLMIRATVHTDKGFKHIYKIWLRMVGIESKIQQ